MTNSESLPNNGHEEKPMTNAEIIAVAAHMALNISSLLRDIDSTLAGEALGLSEKLLTRYDDRSVGLEEKDIEDMKKLIMG